MKAIFFVNKDDYSEAKNKLYGDDMVSRQSITMRDNSALGLEKEGYYVQIEGDASAIRKAKELLSGKAKALTGKHAKEVVDAIEKQESSAAEGFGAIFG